MKRNLSNEIKNIKRLMFINEQVSDRDCKSQLEKSGYTVYTPDESGSEDCMEIGNIKCSYNILSEMNSIDVSIPPKYSNLCRVKVTSKTVYKYNYKNKDYKYNKNYINFWQNGDFTLVVTISPEIYENLVNKEDVPFQMMYTGKFECINDNIEITNLKPDSLYTNFNTNEKEKIEKSFEVKKVSSGNVGTYPATKLFGNLNIKNIKDFLK